MTQLRVINSRFRPVMDTFTHKRPASIFQRKTKAGNHTLVSYPTQPPSLRKIEFTHSWQSNTCDTVDIYVTLIHAVKSATS